MNKKQILFIFIIFILLILLLSVLLSKPNNNTEYNEESKIKVVSTLFPYYDFAREIGKDKINVTLLLPLGAESHNYEPTPSDILNINNCNLFLYTGKQMQPWAETIISSVTNDKVTICDLSNNLNLIHLRGEIHFDETENVHHHTLYDPHVWMDIDNSIIMVNSILNELIKIDSANEDFYRKNANEYIEKLKNLDNEFFNLVNNSTKNKIAFGSEFAYSYFTNRYNLSFISAYDTCGENSEPSAGKMKDVIDTINSNNISVIFADPLSSLSTSQTLSKETNAQILYFYGIHNISKKDFDAGENYISLMTKNLENLKIALQ